MWTDKERSWHRAKGCLHIVHVMYTYGCLRVRICLAQVYKGFDEKQGIDVAWSKVLKEHNQLTDEQMAAIVQEMKVGLDQVGETANCHLLHYAVMDGISGCLAMHKRFGLPGTINLVLQKKVATLELGAHLCAGLTTLS